MTWNPSPSIGIAAEFLMHPAVYAPMDCVADAEDAARDLPAAAARASAPASSVRSESVMNLEKIIV